MRAWCGVCGALKLMICAVRSSQHWVAFAGRLSRRVAIEGDGTELVHNTFAGSIPGHPSREVLTFPYLFPSGTGAFDSSIKKATRHFGAYGKYRMSGFLSPFTLVSTYPFALFLAQQSIKWTTIKTLCLEDQAVKLRRKVPDISEEDLYRQLLKKYVPDSIYGAPSYFKQKYLELKAIVSIFKLPDLFLTFTADEVNA